MTDCTVTLAQPPPVSGVRIALASNNTMLTVPAGVTVPPGANTVIFTAAAGSFRSGQTAIVTASLNGSVATASLTLNSKLRKGSAGVSLTSKSRTGDGGAGPNAVSSSPSGKPVSSLLCAPGVINAGDAVTCELQVPASSKSVPVELTSSSTQVLIPAVVATRPERSSLTFQAWSNSLSQQQTVTITATAGSSRAEAAVLLMASGRPVLRVPEKQNARAGAAMSFTVSAAAPANLPLSMEAWRPSRRRLVRPPEPEFSHGARRRVKQGSTRLRSQSPTQLASPRLRGTTSKSERIFRC